MDRRRLLKAVAFCAAGLSGFGPLAAHAADGEVRALLAAALASGRYCGREEAALRATLARLDRVRRPSSGRSIIVDIPSQTLTAYEGATAALESVVVVGDRGWQTPDLETTVAYVRLNPTWTVPQSILESRHWRERLARDPGYFSNLGFLVKVGGDMLDPEEAAARADEAAQFVQQPGRKNALGQVKFGLNAGDAIYLHDTNDKAAFDGDKRALSHGCMRVQKAVELAAWTLGLDLGEVRGMIDEGDEARRAPASPIRLATTYFTAWPDADGAVVFYDDVYHRDGAYGGCAARSAAPKEDLE